MVTKIGAEPTPSPSPSPSPSPPPAPTFPPPVVPAATVPGAPTNVAVAGGGTNANGIGYATVTWTDPASDGGSPITGHEVTCTSTGGLAVSPQSFSAGAISTGRVTGLFPGVPYTCTVVAINAVGPSVSSAPSTQITVEEEDAVTTITQTFTVTISEPPVPARRLLGSGFIQSLCFNHIPDLITARVCVEELRRMAQDLQSKISALTCAHFFPCSRLSRILHDL